MAGRASIQPESHPRYFSGLDIIQGDPELISRLAGSSSMIQAGVFALDEGSLAFPEKNRAKVEKELETLNLIPRKL